MANTIAQQKDTREVQRKQNKQMLNAMLATDSCKDKFRDTLGKKAPQFMTSILNAVSNNAMLQDCVPSTIIGAGLVAATYDLPIDSNLGFSAMVPYNTKNQKTGNWESKAQFQLMYKGFVQLAVRSGQYESINVNSVYADEIQSANPITGDIVFVNDFTKTSMRAEGKEENIVGYYSYFKLLSGYSHGLYMTVGEVRNHATRYSKSFKDGKGIWESNFDAMAKKTVLKLLLSKWGALSIEMQRAVLDDQKVIDDIDGSGCYADNTPDTEGDIIGRQMNREIIDADATESEDTETKLQPTEESKTEEEELPFK